MKRNIFIRMLSLLLCLSTVTPIAASAGFPNPLNVTTNQMAYVDQFFNHDGSFSDTGNALLHWLDMTPKGEKSALQEDSGYLTLEREIQNRSDGKYGVNKTVNTITGLPAALFGWVLNKEETDYEVMFPNAGKDALGYYQTFQQIYMEYKKAVFNKIVEAELQLDDVMDIIGEIDEYGGELICATSVETSAFFLTNSAKRANANVETADLLEIKYLSPETKSNVRWKVRYADGSVAELNTLEVTEKCRSGEKTLALNNLTGKSMSDVKAVADRGLSEMSSGKGSRKNLNAKTINCETLSNLANGAKNADGYDDLSAQGKKVADKESKRLQESAQKQKENAAKRWDTDIGHALDAVGVAVDAFFYWKNYKNMTALQAAYMDALFSATEEYQDMLSRWIYALEVTDSDYGHSETASSSLNSTETRIAMQDALKRVQLDIAVICYESMETVKDVIEGESFSLTADKRNEVLIGGIGAVLGIAVDEIKLAVSAAKTTAEAGTTAAAAGTTSTVAAAVKGVITTAGKVVTSPIFWATALWVSNSVSGKRVEFADDVTAVSNLKWSLHSLLTEDQNGLLAQYIANRNHETACAIIEALKTMAVAKYYGENLVREYYLQDLYEDLNLTPGSSVYTILWNELQTNSARKLPDLSEVTVPVIVVYEEDVRYVVDGKDGRKVQVLGVFSKNAGTQLSFGGQTLKTFSSETRYQNLHSKDPDTYATMDFKTWSDGWSPNGQNANNRFKSNRAYLYSRNGLDLVITDEEYNKYLDVRDELVDLLDRYYDKNAKISKAEDKNANRLEWTWDCNQWIASFEMYDDATDYSTHKVRHGIVP